MKLPDFCLSRTKRSKRLKYVATLTSRPHSRLAPVFRRGFTFPQRHSGLPPLHRIRLSVENRRQIYDLFYITNKLSHSFSQRRVFWCCHVSGEITCASPKGFCRVGKADCGFTKLFCFFTISLSLILVSACALSVFLVMSAIFLRQIARYPPHQDDGTASKIHLK